jgi:alkyl hydroperoxide reductase subunit AhpC
MSLRLGDKAPNFQAKTSAGEIDFYEYLGDSWGVLFSHPGDYTPVCTTELGKTAALKDEFAKRNVKVLALSVDSVESHNGWINDINETQGVEVNFPIIADEDRKISEAYDMIHPNASVNATVRSLFIIGPDKAVKLIITYPASTGRNFQEILRVIDSLQLTANYGVATLLIGKTEKMLLWCLLPKQKTSRPNFQRVLQLIKPYLRTTPQPNK